MDDITRAMLGDHDAAERLTEHGVMLPCQKGCKISGVLHSVDGGRSVYAVCPYCGIMTRAFPDHKKARIAWNTRAAVLTSEQIERLEDEIHDT